MPGIATWLTSLTHSVESVSAFQFAQTLMLHGPDYSSKTVLHNSRTLLGYVGYRSYPVLAFQFGQVSVVFEGKVYGDSEARLTADIGLLAEQVFDARTDILLSVRTWVADHDGDYLCVMVDSSSGELVSFRDPLGRLPVYYCSSQSELILARECKFILGCRKVHEFDKIAWAQHLWVGYPIGERTLFENIRRLRAGFLLRSRSVGQRLLTHCNAVSDFDCEEKDARRSHSMQRYASVLAEEFMNAVHKRCQSATSSPLVSLSGGHDSRCVAAAVRHSNVDAVAVTCEETVAGKSLNVPDVNSARLIAEQLGMPWHVLSVEPADRADDRRLVWLKDGLNYAGMSFLLTFLDRLVDDWGRDNLYLTGDGGDKLLPEFRPPGLVTTRGSLVQAILSDHSLMPVDMAERAFELLPGTLIDELCQLLESYPERAPKYKAVRFFIQEHGHNWLFEGEDRSRFFFWPVAPFYSQPVFQLALRVPDSLKTRYRLYLEFQRRLDPKLLKISNADLGVSPRSFQGRARIAAWAAGRTLPFWLRVLLRKVSKRRAGGTVSNDQRQDLFALLSPMMDLTVLGEILTEAHAQRHQRHLQNCWTLALVNEMRPRLLAP